MSQETLATHRKMDLRTYLRAQQVVAAHSVDTPDCRVLLEMLGLIDDDVAAPEFALAVDD
ncbi:hypothetical protein G4X40_05290 [Rhodococcus sp. D2-41]|uniref:Uncharacterized protein n=1 Tax=Speluncibacter jeojiensis TaxID=2710754 RepID=A0A9X4M7P3_9ACTN|nr:hypothetical protein [Rhodococcus sp. D2-41]MDG3009558.1 hypothetical protein [Rhodococcus sp. D2-41]MDG3016758.1 hypothetical protein [Corynebacteriales bacterium D3-21]